MTTARTVPVTTEMDGDELDALGRLAPRAPPRPADDRGRVLRALPLRRRVHQLRALALQACLAVVPFLLALTGLAADIDHERPAASWRHVSTRSPPARASGDALASAVDASDASERAGELALVLGLASRCCR